MACTIDKNVIICNLLSYEIKRVDLKDLDCNNIPRKIISYFPELTDQVEEKLKVYIINHNDRDFFYSLKNPRDISLQSLRTYSQIKHGSKVVIFNLFLIGQSILNQDSFTNWNVHGPVSMASLFEEKLEVLKLYALFSAKIGCGKSDLCSEFSHMVTSCLENTYIARNISSFLSSSAASPQFNVTIKTIGEKLQKFNSEDNKERSMDNLINICNALTSRTCEVCRYTF